MKTAFKIATAGAAVLALILTGCSSSPGDDSESGGSGAVDKIFVDTTSMTGANSIARVGGFFDERLGEIGVDVEYTQLGTSSAMLEGLASGKLDFTDIGYSGLPTGAAAGVDFSIAGAASSGAGDIVVGVEGGPTSIQELKGKKVAGSKGASGWALLVRALAENGMSTDDIEFVELSPDAAQNAFLTKQVDAWAIWGGQATEVNEQNSTTLATGEELGLVSGAIASRPEILDNDEVVTAYLNARQDAVDWYQSAPDEVVAAIAADRDMDPALVEYYFTFSTPLNEPVSDELLAQYQEVADLFYEEGELSQRVDISASIRNDVFATAGLS